MRLTAGARVGPYEVLAALGAGGMGEVYRARDTRLGREVALKVISDGAALDSERLQRFEQEARLAGSLNHPNLVVVYDVGSEGGAPFLVTELLEGESLRHRLSRGRLPLRTALDLGVQIAEGLAAAHARGVIHRDVKPENVFLTSGGRAKLLDFGIAKLTAPRPIEGTRNLLDTTLTPEGLGTRPGAVLGTPGYMSPEQVRGDPVDARTDIFSLGTVLYEMLAGAPAFPAKSLIESGHAILESEPPSLPESVPPSVDLLVRRCLEKEPARRFQSAADLAFDLGFRQLKEVDATELPSRRPRWAWLAVAVAGLSAVAALRAWTVAVSQRPSAAKEPMRFLLAPPPGSSFYWDRERDSIALSPEGSQLAYVGATAQAERRVYLRKIVELEARPLPTTEGAESVFWSPDGRSIGFFAQGALKRLDLPDGPAISLCPVNSSLGLSGSWGKTGSILFGAGGKLLVVPATGGKPLPVEESTAAKSLLRWPFFLPDGVHFLYTSRRTDGHMLILSAPGQPPKELMPVGSKVQFTEPDLLLFAREGSLLAQRFDWRRGALSGAPFVVAKQVRDFLDTGASAFASSLSGRTLVLQTANDAQRLVMFGRDGHELAALTGSGDYHDFTISPSGARVAFSRSTPGLSEDVWLFDVERSVESRITSAPGSEVHSLWEPGERALIYSKNQGKGLPQLVRRDLQTGTETSLGGDGFQIGDDLSPDGKALLYNDLPAGTELMLHLGGTAKASRLFPGNFRVYNARFSPDGLYIAFISDESGGWEAYIAPFPGPGERLRLSRGGASRLRWNRTLGTIFYSDPEGKLWSVPVATQPKLRIGTPAFLFVSKSLLPHLRRDPESPAFDVFADAKRFLVLVPDVIADEVPLTVVLNWPASEAN